MKWFKRFVYTLIVIVIAAAGVYGYFLYLSYAAKKQLAGARQYYEKGDIANAVSILESLYSKRAGTRQGRESLYLLCKCYTNTDQLKKAEEYWMTLLDVDKITYGAECLFYLAGIAEQTGRPDLAEKYYKEIVKGHPNSGLSDDALFNLGYLYKEKGELIEAQKQWRDIIEQFPDSNLISTAEQELGDVNIELLFSGTMENGTELYTVQKGDALAIIARRFGTTVELIKKCNNLKSDFIKPGEQLKVIAAKFAIIIDKSRNTLILKAGEKAVKSYRVGTGVSGSTPVGSFTIVNKLINPPWHKAGKGVIPYGDPENVLGTRWMGLNLGGYGIHGTWEPETIGQQASAGCVRLVNKNIEELYQIVPVGTEVIIME